MFGIAGVNPLSRLPGGLPAEQARANGPVQREPEVKRVAIALTQAQFDRMNASPGPGAADGEPFARLDSSALRANDLEVVSVQFVPSVKDGAARSVRSDYSGSAYERTNNAEAVWLVVLRRSGVLDGSGAASTVTAEIIIGDATGEHLSTAVIIDPQE